MIELCISAAKIAKIPVSTKYFEVNFEVSNNIFFQVIETKSMKALFITTGKIGEMGVHGQVGSEQHCLFY